MTTYSSSLRISIIGNGEQSGTWGDTTNTNLGTIIESAITNYVNISVSSTNRVLTVNDGLPDESRNAVLVLTTTSAVTNAFNVFAPPVNKIYIVVNNSAYNATIYCSTERGSNIPKGTGVTVSAGRTSQIWTDGTNMYLVSNSITFPVAVSQGGTGATSFTANNVLIGNGTGAISSTPQLSVSQGGTGTNYFNSGYILTGAGAGAIVGVQSLGVTQGGTGTSALINNALLIGNGTGAVKSVTPGAAGTVLQSDGTQWVAGASAAGVTSVSVNVANGLAGTVANPTTTPAITLRTSVVGMVKGNGTGFSTAVAGTDYAPATSGSSILKGNGTGGFSNATAGTDYAPATSGTSILKGNGTGGFSNATAGTDYAPATSGTSILSGSGSGGFNNVTIGSNLTFTGGTLDATGASPATNTTFGTVIGNTTGFPTYYTSLGGASASTGNSSLALGRGAVASADSSAAVGPFATASGVQSTAVGRGIATGQDTVAAGYQAAASNTSSIAIGRQSTASAIQSIAIGLVTTAAGNGSIAIGRGANASYAKNIVISADNTSLIAPNSGVFIDSFRDESLGSPNKVIKYNTTTKELFYGNASTATGTVTNVSVVSANGLGGTVATSTTTPAITLSTSVSGIVKGDGTGFSAATAGTDYAPATSGTSILKGNGTGGFSNASAGTDYAPATSGTAILYGNGSGGFSSVTIGGNLSFTGGTLSATGGAPEATPTTFGTVYGLTEDGPTYNTYIGWSPDVVGTTQEKNTYIGTYQVPGSNGAIAIGFGTGSYYDNSVAIGTGAFVGSSVFQPSIVISGTGGLAPTDGGFYVDTLRGPIYATPNAVVKYNTTTKEISYDTSVASGTVTNVSVVSANGFNGTVATSTSTPAITMKTTVTGLLQGNGTSGAISAVTIGSNLTYSGGVLDATGGGASPATDTTYGTVYGNTTYLSTNSYVTTLGYTATALNNNAVSIGAQAQSDYNGVAVGVGAKALSTAASGGGSVGIGRAALSNAVNGIAIGANSFINTPANHSIAIGKSASILNANSIVLTASGSGISTPNSGVFIDSFRDESAGSPNKVIKYNTTTKELFYGNASTATGTVTDVSVVSANGFAGTVATSTTTPAITLSTSITGLLKGNGTAISAATAGTDYAPATSGSAILYGNGSGGFSSVTIGSNLTFTGGTLDATGGGASPATPYALGTMYGNTTTATDSAAGLGYGVYVGTNASALGAGSSSFQESVAIGSNVYANYQATSVGYGSLGGASYSTAIGTNAKTRSPSANATVVGFGADTNYPNTIILTGSGGIVAPNSGVFMDSFRDESAGAPNKVIKYDTTTKELFYGAASSGSPATPTVEGILYGNTTAISTNSYVATLGINSVALNNLGTAVGANSTVDYNGVAIGALSQATSTATDGGGSIAIGRSANTSAPYGLSLGYAATVNIAANNSVAIGKNAVTSYASSIVLTASGSGLTAPNAGVFVDSMRDESAGSPNKVIKYNTTTKELFYGAAGGGSGTVTDVSVVTANGFGGSVATSTSTPAITITTGVTGLLKGNGTAVAAATAGTDYQAPITLTTTGTSGAATLVGNTLNIPQYSGGGGSGTVTSVSVVTANGFNGSVATATTTPAITVGTSITGLLRGSGGAIASTTIGSGLDFTSPTLSTVAATATVRGGLLYGATGNATSSVNNTGLGYNHIINTSVVNSTVIGTNANVSQIETSSYTTLGGVSVGYLSKATSTNSVAIGAGAVGGGADSVVIGANATIGSATSYTLPQSIVIGSQSRITNNSSIFGNLGNILIGVNGSIANAQNVIAVGSNISINGTSATNDGVVAIGDNLVVPDNAGGAVIIGSGASLDSTTTDVGAAIAILGNVNGSGGIALGTASLAGCASIAMSLLAQAGNNSIALGSYANATIPNSIVLTAQGYPGLTAPNTGVFIDTIRDESAGSPNKVLKYNTTTKELFYGAAGGTGSVTSVDVSGGTTGLTTSGGPVTTSGTITLGGTLGTANGGTGLTSLGTGVATFLGTPSSANLAAAVTDETGSGSLVFATSPTLVTPILGTPTSGTLSNCTVDGTDAVGFRNLPINSQSAAYTLVLADSGKAILHPSTDANARTFTIPANASVPYPLGTALTFINMTVQNVSIAITSDTMYQAGSGATGTRTLAQYGQATAVKLTSTTWIISGNGLT